MAYKRPSAMPVIEGGTGDITLTNHGVLVGAGTSPITQLSVGTTGTVLVGSTGADPAFSALGTNSGLTAHGVLLGENNSAIVATAAGTNGQHLIGSTGADPVFATVTSSAGSITITGGAGTSNFDIANYAGLTAFATAPALQFGGSSTGITYSTQQGYYSRIGNLVFINISLILTNKGAQAGNATIANLPFAANGTATVFFLPAQFGGTYTLAGAYSYAGTSTSSTSLNLVTQTVTAGTNIPNTAFTNNTNVFITGWYSV